MNRPNYSNIGARLLNSTLILPFFILSIIFYSSPATAQIVIGGEEDKQEQIEQEQTPKPEPEVKENHDGIKTLFDNQRPMTSGGFGAFQMKFTEFMGDGAVLIGGRGAWVINHSFALGGGGYGMSSAIYNAKLEDDLPGQNARAKLEMGYGGVILEPIIMHDKIFHLSFPILIGGGGAEYRIVDPLNFNHSVYRSDGFFVLEPGIDLEINVLTWMRISTGISYRYTSDVNLPETDTDVFRTLNGNLTFKFGRF